MKGSAVALGFKSLASKINSQAPLGAKESSRLLDALTSSFRKHLDEVHPSQQHDEERPSGRKAPSKHAVHSSAAMADMHMASMLTNSLLAKSSSRPAKFEPELHVTESDLATDGDVDPLKSFESAQLKGHATIGLASTCMRRFRKSLSGLSYGKSLAKIQEHKVGTRVFSWLINSECMESQELSDSDQFKTGLVWLLVNEGHEEMVFRWLEADVRLPRPSSRPSLDSRGDQSRDDFWKRAVLEAMVRTKIYQPSRPGCADGALAVYFRGVDSMFQHREVESVRLRATTRTRHYLVQRLCRGSLLPNTDPSLYDKFVCVHARSRYLFESSSMAYKMDEFCHAKLRLWHPTRPSADDFYTLTSRYSHHGAGLDEVRAVLQNTKDDTWTIIQHFTRAAQLSEAGGISKQAQKLLSMALEMYPTNAEEITRSLAYMRSLNSTVLKQGDLKPEQQRKTPSDKQRQKQQEREQNSHWLSQYFPATT